MSSQVTVSPADEMARAAGTSLDDIAYKWPTRRPRLKPHQVKNRVAYIRKAVKHGGLSPTAAGRLGTLLNCSPLLFLHGAAHYYTHICHTGAAEIQPATAKLEQLRRRECP